MLEALRRKLRSPSPRPAHDRFAGLPSVAGCRGADPAADRRRRAEELELAARGGIVGGGVASMHYLGMAALQLPGQITWAIGLVLLSIVLGIVFEPPRSWSRAPRDGRRRRSPPSPDGRHRFASLHRDGRCRDHPRSDARVDAYSLSPRTLALALANAAAAISASALPAFVDRRRANRRLETALNNMSQGLCMFDAAERLIVCNERYLQIYGLSPELAQPGRTLLELLELRRRAGSFSGDPERYCAELRSAIALGRTTNRLVELDDGRTISLVNQPMAGGGWVATHVDVTERRRAERELDRTRSFFHMVIENIPAMVFVKEPREHKFVLVNRAGEKLLGVSREQLIGKSAHDFFPAHDADMFDEHDRAVLEGGELRVALDEHPIQTPHNGIRLVTSKKLPIIGEDGKPEYLLGVVEDVTERQRAEARIAHLAHHDPLTDLPNRAAFNERLAATLERARHRGEPFAVLCIDLDRFKEVNDVFGHSTGDVLLREVVAPPAAAAAEGAFLARLGGDEFTSDLDRRPAARPTAEALAERLLAAVADELQIEAHRLRIGLSIGVAIFPADGADATALLANADAALYRAKAEGRGAIRFFEADMDSAAARAARAAARAALGASSATSCCLHYQPQARDRRRDHRLRGAGALASSDPRPGAARHLHSARRGKRPHHPIGEWILREACREAASWPKPLQIAINLSPVQFRHGDLRRPGASGAAGDRARAEPARTRDHRGRADRRLFARAVDPAPAQGARRAHRHGRFRHRLFVAVLSAVVPVRQDQDRPDLHLQPRAQPAIGRDRARRDRARPRARPAGGGRGRRDADAARLPAQRGLRRGAGLSDRAAGTHLPLRRDARGARPRRNAKWRARADCAHGGRNGKPSREHSSRVPATPQCRGCAGAPLVSVPAPGVFGTWPGLSKNGLHGSEQGPKATNCGHAPQQTEAARETS